MQHMANIVWSMAVVCEFMSGRYSVHEMRAHRARADRFAQLAEDMFVRHYDEYKPVEVSVLQLKSECPPPPPHTHTPSSHINLWSSVHPPCSHTFT